MIKNIILVIILLVSFWIRFKDVAINPNAMYVDESAIGYNAYSLLKTGKDEYGVNYPITIRSFGDYKAPVYTYMLIPIYKFWGMSVLTTRIVSVVAGVVTILFAWLLIGELGGSGLLQIVSGITMALSPWMIIFSRGTYESNLAMALMTIGLWALVKGMKNGFYLVIGSLFLAMSMLAYHAQRLMVPMMLIPLAIYYRKELLKNKKWVIGGLLLGFLILLPTIMILTTPGVMSRAETLNIFKNNDFVSALREWMSLYVAYFSPRYLFNLGDVNLRSSYVDLSTFFVWQMPIMLIGAYSIIKNRKNKLNRFFIIWLLFAPIPASFTRDPYYSLRALAMVVPLCVIVGIGSEIILKKKRWLGLVTMILVVYLSWGRLSISMKMTNTFRSQAWGYGTEKLVEELEKTDKSLPIMVDHNRNQQYIDYLFYSKFDPNQYQMDNRFITADDYYTNTTNQSDKVVGRVKFSSMNWATDMRKEQIIVFGPLGISDAQVTEHKLEKMFFVNDTNGVPTFKVYKTLP